MDWQGLVFKEKDREPYTKTSRPVFMQYATLFVAVVCNVAGAWIEHATQGFSVPRSTTELPGHG